MTTQDDEQRYLAAAHAMQSGVAQDILINPKQTEAKHVRVGINSALVNDAAIATLLIEKGVFTHEEYVRAVADAMEREVDKYEELLTEAMGVRINLA